MQGLTAFFAYSRANQNRLLAVGAVLIVLIAMADWKVEPNVSLGILYLFPILLMAGFLNRPETVALASVCAVLREAFINPVKYGVKAILLDYQARNTFACSCFHDSVQYLDGSRGLGRL